MKIARRFLQILVFEKDFFKLMNNSCYGKTMETVRNRIEFKLVSNEAEFDKVKRI